MPGDTLNLDPELYDDGQAYTPRRGRFKGQTFGSKAEFEQASREASATKDTRPLDLDKPRSMRKQIGLLVDGLNDVLRAIPVTREDALEQGEAERLVGALDQAQQANGRIRKFVLRSTEGAGVLPLIFVGVSILLSRLLRHGLLPGTRERPLTEAELQQLSTMDAGQRAAIVSGLSDARQAQWLEWMQAYGWQQAQANGHGPVPEGEPLVPPIYTTSNV